MKKEIINSPSEILVDAPRNRGHDNDDLKPISMKISKKTSERFEKATKGARSICVETLLDYALDMLAQSGQKIIVKE